jgi:acyl-CoA synthetase (AMP-forming)/AMP-acid ligase II
VLSIEGLWSTVERRAAETPDAEMLVDAGGRRMTFGEYRDAAEVMAAGLADLGVGAGDVVAWELPTWIETVVLAAALSRLGAVQLPIIAIYRDREVGHCCREARARFLLTPGPFRGYDLGAMGARVAAELPGLTHVVVAPGDFPAGDPSTLGAAAPSPARDDTRWLCYTSGTTSAPKGARHSDLALSAVAGAFAERSEIEPGDRYALVFPFPHVGGVILLFSTLRTGSTSLLDEAFDPQTTVAFLAREGVTHAGTGTPFHLAYLAAQRARPDEPLFPDLKCCPGGGAPKPPTIHAQVKAELGGAGVVSSWGLTEAPLLTVSGLHDPDDRLARCEGRPVDGVALRVVDGEIQATGPQVMLGYVDASLDADAFTEDGWYRTGDLGTVDADGFVTITGRLKDVIIRNGENVAAKEVEDLLFEHPAVADAAVLGVPDERTGERVVAVVALVAGASLSLDQVRDHLRDRGLRRQAVPEQLEVVDALPRNPSGKVTKQVLRDQLVGGRSQA